MAAPEWVQEVDLAGGCAVAARRLTGGEINETFLARTATGERFVVRRAPETVADWHPTIEGVAAAMRLARESGVPVPEVVFARGRVLAYRYVPGHRMTEQEAARGLARHAGRLHGLMHAIEGDGLGPVQRDGTSPRWPPTAAFGDVMGWADALPDGPAAPLDKATASAAAELFEAHRPSHRHRLTRGDSTLNNTLVSRGRVAALIDFDDAWYGDPAGDMAWWWWGSPATADHFATGCQETSSPTAPLRVWLFRVHLLLGLADTFAAAEPATASRRDRLLPIAIERIRRLI